MNVPAELLEALVTELAAELAPRIAVELLARQPAPTEDAWGLVTLEEAAAALTRSTRWVRERTKRGDLPHVRLGGGGALAYRREDLEHFAAAHRVPAEAGPTLAAACSTSRKPAPAAASGGADQVDNRKVVPR